MSPRESVTKTSAAAGARVLEPIASTKISPPRGTRLIPRDALVARLLEARRKRCLVMQGPPGSGKTSILIAWRQALIPLANLHEAGHTQSDRQNDHGRDRNDVAQIAKSDRPTALALQHFRLPGSRGQPQPRRRLESRPNSLAHIGRRGRRFKIPESRKHSAKCLVL